MVRRTIVFFPYGTAEKNYSLGVVNGQEYFSDEGGGSGSIHFLAPPPAIQMRNFSFSLILAATAILLVTCNGFEKKGCPDCAPLALHFAFFDSASQQKIIPNSVTVVRDGLDTFSLADTVFSNKRLYREYDEYFFTGPVGVYSILVKDSVYQDFTFGGIAVDQNPEYRDCGVLPHTVHIKILVKKPSIMGKKTHSGNYRIYDQYADGSC